MSASTRPAFQNLRSICAAAVAMFAGLTTSELAHGQTAQMTAGVKVDGTTPVDVANLIQNPRLAGQLRSVVVPIMQIGKANGAQEENNFDLFVVYRIAELTLPPTDNKDTIDRRRQKIKAYEILRITGNPNIPQDLHTRANQLMLKNLVPLIGNAQYPMDARYNAMLLLGMLDSVEPDSAAAREAVPLDAAEPILLQASQTAALPEILRIGALIGLARHCELKLAATNRQAIANEALKLLSTKTPPEGYSANGFHWARKCALQMVTGLAQTGAETNKPEFVQAMNDLMADDTQPLFLRRDAALAFGYIDPAAITASTKTKPADICRAMANLTSAVTKAGQPRFDPSAPVDLSKPEDVLPTPNEDNKLQFANSVGYYLNCIAVGLGGRTTTSRGLLKAIPAGDPVAQNASTLLNTHVNPLVTALAKPNPDSNRLLSDLQKSRDQLDQWLQQTQLAAPGGAGPAAPAGGAPLGAAGALATPVAPR